METQHNHSTIACPSCGHSFSPEIAIETNLRTRLEQEFQLRQQQELARIRKEATEEQQAKLDSMIKENELKLSRLRELELKELDWGKREREIKNQEEQIEITLKRKLLEQEENIRLTYERQANEKADLLVKERLIKERDDLQHQITQRAKEEIERIRTEGDLKQKELQKKLEDQNTLVTELKRKSEQGSMQLQGEVQEIALEEFLSQAFPFDTISPIAKGINGADCIQTVRSTAGQICGKIIYESKRTKHFGGDWIEKLKTDMRSSGCDIAILVTQVYPNKDMIRFASIDGVWVCSFAEVKSLSMILRSGLLKVGEALSSQENKGTKMQMLYDYLTGTEFRNYVETVIESFSTMKSELDREKRAFLKIWAEREKQIEKLISSTIGMYGSVKGIAGAGIHDIPQLQLFHTLPA